MQKKFSYFADFRFIKRPGANGQLSVFCYQIASLFTKLKKEKEPPPTILFLLIHLHKSLSFTRPKNRPCKYIIYIKKTL